MFLNRVRKGHNFRNFFLLVISGLSWKHNLAVSNPRFDLVEYSLQLFDAAIAFFDLFFDEDAVVLLFVFASGVE